MLFRRNFHRWLMGGEFREFPKRDLIDWPIRKDRRALRRVTPKSIDVIFRTRGVRIVY